MVNLATNYGYVIFSNCISKDNCDKLRNLWDQQVKPYKGKIYRQTTAKAEKNKFNNNNWIMNPIVNLQSLNPSLFGELKLASETEVFSNDFVCKALKLILGEKPKIVQSMYFEGNSATWEHQDTYYLDSEKIGKMTAGWIALEEIKADDDTLNQVKNCTINMVTWAKILKEGNPTKDARHGSVDINESLNEGKRIPRKKGQKAKSKKHSDLYTDEDPKGTIHGLGFKDEAAARSSVAKIRKSGRSHAHKIQAAVAMEQRAKAAGKSGPAAIYRKFINSMKKKTKAKNKKK